VSRDLLNIVSRYLKGEMSVDRFVDEYMSGWKNERDDDLLRLDEPALSEALSSMFCIADLYNKEADREGYELDEEGVREALKDIFNRFSLEK